MAIKIFVSNEEEKQQLLEASEHIHDKDVDTDLPMVNLLAHLHLSDNIVRVEDVQELPTTYPFWVTPEQVTIYCNDQPISCSFETLKRINQSLSIHTGEWREDYKHDGAYHCQVSPWRAKEEGLPITKICLSDSHECLWTETFTKKEFKKFINELIAVHDMMDDESQESTL